MRVELLQRGNDGVFRYFVHIGGVDIKVVDEIKDSAHFLGVHLCL